MGIVRLLGCVLALTCAITALSGPGAFAANTTLCSAEAEECLPENTYPKETAIEATLKSGTKSTFATSFGSVACSSSTFSGKTSELYGEPLDASITAMTFGECKLAGTTSCTLAPVKLPYGATFAATEGGDGTLTMSSGGSGSPGASVVCGIFINCTVSASSVAFQLNGGNPGAANVTAAKLTGSGSKCPEKIEWSAEYQVQQPKPIFVEKLVFTMLCKEKEKACKKAGNPYLKGTTLEAKQETKPSFSFKYKGATESFTCDESSLKIEITADSGAPLPGLVKELTFSKCNNKCSVKANGIPYLAEFRVAMPEGDAGVPIRSSGAPGPPVFEIKCDTKTCLYLTNLFEAFNFEGGKPAHFSVTEKFFLLKEYGAVKSDADCDAGTEKEPYPMTWASTKYEVTKPTEVFAVLAK